MTLRAGNNPSPADVPRVERRRRRTAFTLIELILVMGLLSLVFAVASPSLSRFFRGRALEGEARRLAALAQYGQNRAVSEGIPMLLWVDEENKAYGLQAATGYLEGPTDTNALEYTLAERLEIEVAAPPASASTAPWHWSSAVQATAGLPGVVETARGQATLVAIQFLPSGFISESSPRSIELRQGEDGREGRLWISQSHHRLHYEIRTNAPPDFLRW